MLKSKLIILAGLLLMNASTLLGQNYQIIFGDLHQHSALSWDANPGSLSPLQAFAYAQNNADLDFLAISDHANDLNNGQLLQGWQMLRDAAGTSTTFIFVGLASLEVGSTGTSGYGHVVVHNSPDLADDNVRYNLNTLYDFLISGNALAHFCHPGISGDASSKFNNFAYEARVDSFVYGIEVLSGFNSTPYEPYYFLVLEKGWHVGAVAGQDNHSGNYGNRVDGDGNINLTGVLLDTLSHDKLMDAFRNHRTYAFQTSPAADRLFLTEFTADGHWMGEDFENADNVVTFNVEANAQTDFLSAQLYKNGRLFKKLDLDSNNFTWITADSATFGSAYYLLKLVQQDTDVLWSSPIWVNSPGETPPVETVITPIAELRRNYANGLPANLEVTNVTIRGVATAGREFGFDGPGFLQDSTGGIAIFGSAFVEKVIPGFALEFEVTGKVSVFNGLTEITPHSATRLGVSTFPEILPVTTQQIAVNGEALEGRLVRVTGATLSGNFPPTPSNANLTINDGSGPCTLRIDGDTNIGGSPTPASPLSVIGVIGQFDTSLPYDSGYQLQPRSVADFSMVTSVDENASEVPASFGLGQNFPNPFNAETRIVYTVPVESKISVKIYNTNGREIRALVDETAIPGEYTIVWDGRDNVGMEVASGVFFCQLNATNAVAVRKLILLR
jgi:hypothetical protein